MSRSSQFPRRHALNGIVRIIRHRTRSVTVSRTTETKDSLDQTTTTTNDHTEEIWLFRPREINTREIAGEQLSGQLGGLTVADGDVDMQHNDRVTHGGVEYEVDTIIGQPNDDEPDGTPSPDTKFWLIDFERRQ